MASMPMSAVLAGASSSISWREAGMAGAKSKRGQQRATRRGRAGRQTADTNAMVARSALHPLASPRFDRLDRLRGLALLWMAAFHFCFDLANWRLIQANFYADPLWTTQRTCILSLFLR